MRSVKYQVISVKTPVTAPEGLTCHAFRHASTFQLFNASTLQRAFTLIELLVVISIMALIAALAVPALKNLGKSNIQASASRQFLDDVGRARQLAISDHTTVYMIFVRSNFWMETSANTPDTAWRASLTPVQSSVASNLCDKQFTGYTFVSLRSAGDQPGQGKCRYLAPWQSLPAGSFISQSKFQLLPPSQSQIPFYINGNNVQYPIYGFCVTNTIPFPTQDSQSGATLHGRQYTTFQFPYIAFNYLGQLTFDGLDMAWCDEYIPLAQGSVLPAIDVPTKTPLWGDAADAPSVNEAPAGNDTNTMYNIIHIDRVTGRAVLEYQHVQ